MNTLFTDLGPATSPKLLNVRILHQMGCRACPLAKAPHTFADMPATGAAHPLVYILGEAPGAEEIKAREQFVGASGKLLRARIPKAFRDKLRFNNVVRSHPYKNVDPDEQSIECCRPSIIRDIEQSKPKAIFGFGNVPLNWVSGFSGVTLWRGRRMPVKIGNHVCWYYPMLHPAFVLRLRRGDRDDPTHIGSEEERMFAIDLKRAFEDIDSLPKPVVHTPRDVWKDIETITTYGAEGLRRIDEWLDWAVARPETGVDYETDRLRPYAPDARVLSAAVATGARGFSFPIDHPEAEWSEAEKVKVRDKWRGFLREAKRRWVHNLAFELEWTGVYFGKEFIRIGDWQDTAVQAAILDERRGKQKPGPFSLEFLVQQRFGFNLKKLTNLDRKNLADADINIVLRYNGGDARYHYLLGREQTVDIEADGLEEAYDLGLRRVPCVVLTQMKGIPVDQSVVKRLSKKYEKRIKDVTAEITALPVIQKFERIKGTAFKPLSNPDVLYVLKDLLKREEVSIVDKYTKKPKYSADEKVLVQIDHPLSQLLLRLRKANKQRSTYIDPLLVDHKDSLIHVDLLLHAIFNTIFAETGRLSCELPNLQNFPKRNAEGKEVRGQIVAPPGCLVLAVDYGQLEARVIAMITKDKAFVKSLWENYDVHMEWAQRLAHAYPARIGGKKNLTDKGAMKDFRTDIKNQWTFPLFFGAQLGSVAGYLKMPEDVLQPLRDEFWRVFAGVKEWQEELLKFYRANGYVECLTGRRRRGPLSLNQVINSPVQGTAAEIVMDAMCRLSETGDEELQADINIHDDLTYVRVPAKRVDDVAEKIIGHMIKVPFSWAKTVPMAVEMSVGQDWLNLEEAGTFYSHEWGK